MRKYPSNFSRMIFEKKKKGQRMLKFTYRASLFYTQKGISGHTSFITIRLENPVRLVHFKFTLQIHGSTRQLTKGSSSNINVALVTFLRDCEYCVGYNGISIIELFGRSQCNIERCNTIRAMLRRNR